MSSSGSVPLRDVAYRQLRAACSTCSLQELCLPLGLTPQEMGKLEGLITQGRNFRKGDHLYRAGEGIWPWGRTQRQTKGNAP